MSKRVKRSRRRRIGRQFVVITDVHQVAPGCTRWSVTGLEHALRERRYKLGAIEDALAERVWGMP